MNIIETDSLTKRYGKTIAVNNVSIHVMQGEIYGFLGLNGAGKTTTILLLLGLIRPDTGNCKIFDEEPKQATNIWNEIGYMVETPHAYPNLTVVENLKVICKLRNIQDKFLIDETLNKLHLYEYRNRKERNLSTGNRQRLGLARALIHKPKLLILDEPVNGLDPAGIVEIRKLLKDLSENNGTTIFISSHILTEIARLTNRIGIIHNGSLIREIESSELHKKIVRKLYLSTSDNDRAFNILNQNGYTGVQITDRIELTDEKAMSEPETVATILVKNNTPPKELFIFEEDLEQYFLRTIKQ